MVISKKAPQPSSEKVSVLLPPKQQQQQSCGKASAAPARRPRRGKGAIKEDGPCAGQRLPAPSAGLSGDKGHPSINPSLNPSVHPSTRPSAPHGPAAASGPGAARGLHLAAPGGGCRRGPGPAPARSRGSPFPVPGIPDIPGTRHSRRPAFPTFPGHGIPGTRRPRRSAFPPLGRARARRGFPSPGEKGLKTVPWCVYGRSPHTRPLCSWQLSTPIYHPLQSYYLQHYSLRYQTP